MRISDISEHSRYENFALTRMFYSYKHCFCDSNIPSSRDWLNRNHFPHFIISNRMQRLNIQALVLQQENLRHTNNMRDLKAFVDCATETELSSLFSVSLSLSWPSFHHGRVTKTIKGIMRKLTLSCDTYAKIATVNVHNSLKIKYFTFTMTKFLYSLCPVCDRSFSLD